MLLKNHATYHFGDFSLDPVAKVLFRDNQPVHLTRKAVETLLVLVENAGQVLTKDELLSAVWGDRVVDEANLAQNVAVIRKALAAPKGTPGFIETFPGRGYRIEGPVTRSLPPLEAAAPEAPSQQAKVFAETPVSPAKQQPVSRLWLPALIAGVATIGALVAISLWLSSPTASSPEGGEQPAFRVQALSRLPGKEFQPALSRDGTKVAFLWTQSGADPPTLWIQQTSGTSPRQLTREGGAWSSPAWSPDGKRIAALRIDGQKVTVLIIDAAAGEQHEVATLPPPRYRLDNRLLDWSPDGSVLAVSHSGKTGEPLHVSLVDLATRQISGPISGPATAGIDWDDVSPRFSPDGKQLAFVRRFHRLRQEVFVVPVSGGSPRQVTRANRQISDYDWTAGGDSVVAALLSEGEYRLRRIAVGGGAGSGQTLGVYGEFPIHLSIARGGQTLAYSPLHQDRNVWSLDLVTRRFTRVAASSAQDASPEFSPDGQEICFRSDRSGDEHLWVSQADGSGAVQITRGSIRPSVGRWSPDGQSIVFNDPRDSAIYIATRSGNTGGGWALRATGWTGIHPVFSRDGEALYAGGPDSIFRISLSTGHAELVVKTHGFSLDIDANSEHIYFVRDPNGTTLWRASLRTGAVEKAVEGLVPGCTSCWALSRKGLYYLSESPNSPQEQKLFFQSFGGSSGPRLIIDWPEYLWPMGSGPFSLSPDGRSLLAVRVDPSDSDVMLVSPFR